MKQVTLQVPMEMDLKNRAKTAAKENGFSSLQEVVRVFLTKFANKQVDIGINQRQTALSPTTIKEYDEMTFEADDLIGPFETTEELMKALQS